MFAELINRRLEAFLIARGCYRYVGSYADLVTLGVLSVDGTTRSHFSVITVRVWASADSRMKRT